jgi:hypothetical protein
MAQVALVSMKYGRNEHSLLKNTYSSTPIVDQLHTRYTAIKFVRGGSVHDHSKK